MNPVRAGPGYQRSSRTGQATAGYVRSARCSLDGQHLRFLGGRAEKECSGQQHLILLEQYRAFHSPPSLRTLPGKCIARQNSSQRFRRINPAARRREHTGTRKCQTQFEGRLPLALSTTAARWGLRQPAGRVFWTCHRGPTGPRVCGELAAMMRTSARRINHLPPSGRISPQHAQQATARRQGHLTPFRR